MILSQDFLARDSGICQQVCKEWLFIVNEYIHTNKYERRYNTDKSQIAWPHVFSNHTLFKWALDLYKNELKSRPELLCKYGDVDTLNEGLKKRILNRLDTSVMVTFVKRGSNKLISWGVNKRFTVPIEAGEAAIQYNRLKTLKFLFSLYRTATKIWAPAAFYATTKFIGYPRQLLCYFTLMGSACQYNRLEIAKYIHESFTHFINSNHFLLPSTHIILAIVGKCSIEMIEWIYRRGRLPFVISCIETAAETGREDVILWLLNRNNPITSVYLQDNADEMYYLAGLKDHADFMEYIYNLKFYTNLKQLKQRLITRQRDLNFDGFRASNMNAAHTWIDSKIKQENNTPQL